MRRFFINPDKISGLTGIISGPEARHIRLVLRLETGRKVELFDGKGNIYQAIIQGVNKDKITVKIIDKKIFIDNGPQIYLGQALLKGKKMDLLIQKATELGIHAIHPFISTYCAKRSSASRNKRWNKISIEACKQCGRPMPPECLPVQEFSKIISNASNCAGKIIFWEKETKYRLTPQIAKHKSIFFLVGPEGGFSSKEIEEARNHGFQTVTLGQRTLRAETAALCAMSIIQFMVGNLDL